MNTLSNKDNIPLSKYMNSLIEQEVFIRKEQKIIYAHYNKILDFIRNIKIENLDDDVSKDIINFALKNNLLNFIILYKNNYNMNYNKYYDQETFIDMDIDILQKEKPYIEVVYDYQCPIKHIDNHNYEKIIQNQNCQEIVLTYEIKDKSYLD